MYTMNSEIDDTIHLKSNLSCYIHSEKYVHEFIKPSYFFSTTLSNNKMASTTITTLFNSYLNNSQQPLLGIDYIYLYMKGLLEPSLQPI
jgi:hypothetical protein